MTELEDAWIDWYFENYDLLRDLEERGYRWQYVGQDLPRDLAVGEYALITGEFPHGDVLLSKKHVKLDVVLEHDLVAISRATRNAVSAQRVFDYFGEEGIELTHEDNSSWVALVHPATRPRVAWQGTKFDYRGPVGHEEGNTREEVVEKLVDRGFTIPEEGALERVLGDPADWFLYTPLLF